MMKKPILALAWLAVFMLATATQAPAQAPNYDQAFSLGDICAQEAADLLSLDPTKTKVVVLTNAGYSMPQDLSSRGCLDGISASTTASIGASTLVTLQSRRDAPLWFAFYSPESGECAYLECTPQEAAAALKSGKNPQFSLKQKAIIDADHIFAHPKEFADQIKNGLFGANAFRVVTVANAAARNCPDHALQAMTVHDHFCPGVSSGVILADHIQKKIIRPEDKGLFILSLTPWCKEDALTTLLNATPGKKSYAAVFGNREKTAHWPKELQKVCTIAFTKDKGGLWTGYLLGFDFDRIKSRYQDKNFDFAILDKLYADLWFLQHMDKPENFVDDLGRVQLPKDVSPTDLLQPDSNLFNALAPQK